MVEAARLPGPIARHVRPGRLHRVRRRAAGSQLRARPYALVRQLRAVAVPEERAAISRAPVHTRWLVLLALRLAVVAAREPLALPDLRRAGQRGGGTGGRGGRGARAVESGESGRVRPWMCAGQAHK